MGLFDKLRGNEDFVLTPQAGLLLAAISMVAIDGDIDDDEMAIIRRLDGSRSTEAWEMAVRAWKTKPLEECVSLAAQALNPEQRLIALANLIDIAMADGLLAGSEKDLLEVYVERFGVAEASIAEIVQVIALKNNKSAFS